MDGSVVAGIERLVEGLDSLGHVELAERLQEAERIARLLESAKAAIVEVANRTEAFADDGHRSVRNWVQATIRVRRSDAHELTRLACLCTAHPVVFEHLGAGTLSIAAAHRLARVHANPRVAEQLSAVIDAFVTIAERAPHDTFVAHLGEWERLADADGPTPDPHDHRHASCSIVGGVVYLRAALIGVAGAEVKEILDRFSEAEFAAEWDELRAVQGDDADLGQLARTEAQRRADALAAVFRRAAATDPDARDPQPVVDVVTSQAMFEEQLRAVVEQRRPNLDLLEPTRVWSETHNGVAILPAEMLAAAAVGSMRRVVIDHDGLIIDLGRRRRLFTGAAAKAADLQHALDRAGRCLWPGCGRLRTQHDHVEEWARDTGSTCVANEGPMCGPHNFIKTRGYRTWRDASGTWHTRRPDGTEITTV